MKTPALTGEFSTRLQTVCAACIICVCLHTIILTYQYLNIYRQRLWVLFACVFASVRCTVSKCALIVAVHQKSISKVAGLNRVIPLTFPSSLCDSDLLADEGTPSSCVSITMKGR